MQRLQVDKLLAFEYVLKTLLEWHRQQSFNYAFSNDLSTLKSIKLLFFVSAVKANPNSPGLLLDQVFDNFVAMPYGHVESGVYNEIRRRAGELTYYRIDNRTTVLKPGASLNNLELALPNVVKSEIISSIETLKHINPRLISLSAFELVDLSHSWYSWQHAYLHSNSSSSSVPISKEDIRKENKIFSLQIF